MMRTANAVYPGAPRAFDSGTQPPRYRVPETPQGAERAAAAVRSIEADDLLRRSADVSAMVEYWDLTDAIIDGHEAMIKGADKFLPRFPDEPNEEYQFRLANSKFTNIFRDIVEGLASKPFEQEITLIKDENKAIPEAIEKFVENVDGSGNNLTGFGSAVFFAGIASAIDWIFVDHPPRNQAIRNMADAKRAGLRVFWSRVLGRNVYEPKAEVINGEEVLTYIKIFEPGGGKAPDRVREFERLPTGQIVWRLWEKQVVQTLARPVFVLIVDDTPISIDVIPLVPFATGRRDGRTFRFVPAMRDAADLQRQLYKSESGLEFAKVLTAYPMLTGNGVKPEMEADGKTVKRVRVGPARILYAPVTKDGTVGSWSYIEPNATSLQFLASDIKTMKEDLRELGRQPLTAQSGNLTVISAAAASSKAKSAVAMWALMLKNALENALVITCKWLAINEAAYDPQVNVYTEFDEFTEGKDVEALRADRDAGDLSQETYWEEMKRRGIYSPEFDPEVERQRLLDETPADGEEDVDDTNPDDDANQPPLPGLEP